MGLGKVRGIGSDQRGRMGEATEELEEWYDFWIWDLYEMGMELYLTPKFG